MAGARKTTARVTAALPERRRFMQTVAGAGVLGAFGGAALAAQTAAPPAAGPAEFPAPAGMKKGAQLDSRFPVSFATPVSEGLRLVIAYFAALSQRDTAALAKTLHFPFAIYEDIEPVVVNTEADFLATPPPSLNGTGKGKSRIMRGSYDLLESVNVHLYCPIGGVYSLTFVRYAPDGHKLLTCDGIYAVTNNDGRWAIQMASTIVHESGYENIRYPDAEQADIRGNQNYLAAFGYGNERILNDLKSGRGSYERPLPPGTRTASVSFGYGPRERSRDARMGQPTIGWRTKGVKSRLVVRVVKSEDREQAYETNLAEFVSLAGGAVGEYGYTRDRPERPVVIHATHDKAHTISGYLRFTPDGQLISETRGIGIRIYKEGAWSSGGGMGQVTHHDRSNSV